MRKQTLSEIARQIYAAWKFSRSLFKKEWTIDDYPISIRFQEAKEPPRPRLKLIPWFASVINWPGLTGGGDTKQEAIDKLRENFNSFKANRSTLPRPGSHVPIEFAESSTVDRYPELAKDFVQRVLGLESAWISDSSSLWDFHGEATNDKLNDKIREIYEVDVSDLPKAMLADIFDRITQQQKSNQ